MKKNFMEPQIEVTMFSIEDIMEGSVEFIPGTGDVGGGLTEWD